MSPFEFVAIVIALLCMAWCLWKLCEAAECEREYKVCHNVERKWEKIIRKKWWSRVGIHKCNIDAFVRKTCHYYRITTPNVSLDVNMPNFVGKYSPSHGDTIYISHKENIRKDYIYATTLAHELTHHIHSYLDSKGYEEAPHGDGFVEIEKQILKMAEIYAVSV